MLAVAVAGSVTSASAHDAIVNSVLVSGLSGLKGFSVVVPEPATFALIGIGGLSLLLFRRLRK